MQSGTRVVDAYSEFGYLISNTHKRPQLARSLIEYFYKRRVAANDGCYGKEGVFGSLFSFCAESFAEVPMNQAANNARPGKILVVEDNVDSRDLLAKLLGMRGYEVFSASDGESGYAAALNQVPDLIITDINMPGMDGIALLKKVRLERLLTGTAVFVVTAFGGEAAREAVEAGADAATGKPFDFNDFVETVRSLIFTRRKLADG